MKIMRAILFVIAGLLIVWMVSTTIMTNVKSKKPAGGLSEYESGNIEDLPEKRVDTTLELDSGLNINDEAPDFELTSLDGEKVKLSDYRGKTVMLNFWASWCPPCRVEMPHMETYYQNNKDADVEILAVNMTTIERGSKEKVSEFVKKHKLTFPILMDEKGTAKDLYNVMVYPTTYIVSPEGIITDKVMIPLDVETIKWLFDNSGKVSDQ